MVAVGGRRGEQGDQSGSSEAGVPGTLPAGSHEWDGAHSQHLIVVATTGIRERDK